MILRKTTAFLMFVGALVVFAAVAWAGTDDATVSMTATVDTYAEWSDTSPTIGAGDWTGSVDGTTINYVGEDLTVTKNLSMYANADITISAAGGTNSGIATTGASVDTLTTSYQIRGDVTVPDSAYKAAGTGGGEFFEVSNTYTVTHTPGDGSYAIDLMVQLESDDAGSNESGNYTCDLILTASWT